MPHDTALRTRCTPDECAALRRLIEEGRRRDVLSAIGIGETTILRAIAGLEIRRGSVALIANFLARQASRAA